MSTTLGANAISAAVFDLLQDATLQAAIDGRLVDSQPQDQPRPCALYSLYPESNDGGFGLTRGPFRFNLRINSYSDLGSVYEVNAIDDLFVGLLTDATLTISGGSVTHVATIRYQPNGVPAFVSELSGVLVHEKVSDFLLWVEMV